MTEPSIPEIGALPDFACHTGDWRKNLRGLLWPHKYVSFIDALRNNEVGRNYWQDRVRRRLKKRNDGVIDKMQGTQVKESSAERGILKGEINPTLKVQGGRKKRVRKRGW